MFGRRLQFAADIATPDRSGKTGSKLTWSHATRSSTFPREHLSLHIAIANLLDLARQSGNGTLTHALRDFRAHAADRIQL